MAERVLSTAINTDTIKNIPLLSGLTEAEKDAFLKESSLYSYNRKEHLFREGDPIKYFHIICSGAVRLYHETRDGHEVTSDIRTTGDTVCTTCIFTPSQNHDVHAEVIQNALIMVFPMQWLIDATRQYSIIASNLLSAISQRLRNIKMEAGAQTVLSTTQRVACLLKRMCVTYGLDPDGFSLPYSKSLIASLLGLRLETLSRTLPKLAEMGITAKGKHIALHDLQSLEQNLCRRCPNAENCYARKSLMPPKLAFGH